jgi:hypothetical protein
MREQPLTKVSEHIYVLDVRNAPYRENPVVRAQGLWSWVDYRIGTDAQRNPSNSHWMIPGTIEAD